MAGRFSLAGFLDAASSAIQNLGNAPEGMPGRIWQEVAPWVMQLSRSATEKWLPVLTQARACDIAAVTHGVARPCTNHAVTKCCACKRHCCIHHCCADQHGDVICYGCVADQIRVKQGIPPRIDPTAGHREPPVADADRVRRVKEAYKVLGLRQGASWEKVEERKKELLKKHHPDRFLDPAIKATNEARYKAVMSAYTDLERFVGRQAA